MKKIKTNRKNLNKSVRKKKKVDEVQLTFSQYENIIMCDITPARICNVFKINCSKQFFIDLRANRLPKYHDWHSKVKK